LLVPNSAFIYFLKVYLYNGNKATVPARQWCWQQPTALTDQKGDANNRTPKTAETPKRLGKGMPATTGTHRGLKIFFFL
jgi:hypothetical protein